MTGCAGAISMTISDSEAITMPVKFRASDLTKPSCPPPQAKNDAQAMKVTNTGSGRIVAVRYVSIAPRTPRLIIAATRGGIGEGSGSEKD